MTNLQNDRNGSKADLTAPKSDFRFASESGLNSDIAPCPFGARTGLIHCSKGLCDLIMMRVRHVSETSRNQPSAVLKAMTRIGLLYRPLSRS